MAAREREPEVRRLALGRWGEGRAAAYLERQGYRILDRNVRTPCGEIDLIACRGSDLIFVEVKTRRNKKFGFPEAAVNRAKQARVQAAAEHYLQRNSTVGSNCRIDVIAVEKCAPPRTERILHFENAF